jgi:hypothetical protein
VTRRVEVREVTPGEYEVAGDGPTRRVVVPAGVGVPGVAEDELVALVVAILEERGDAPTGVLDVSHLLGADPTLYDELARRAEETP